MAHPKIKVAETNTEKILNLISMLAIIGIFVYTFYMFGRLPDSIPIHFNGAGEADGWGSKLSIIFIPILVTLLFVGMYILSKFPHVFNYPIKVTEENAPRLYPLARLLIAIINIEMVLLFAFLHINMIQSAITGEDNISDVYALLFIFIPLVTCIVFLVKLSNLEK